MEREAVEAKAFSCGKNFLHPSKWCKKWGTEENFLVAVDRDTYIIACRRAVLMGVDKGRIFRYDRDAQENFAP